MMGRITLSGGGGDDVDAVESVDGRTGVVTLSDLYADIDAAVPTGGTAGQVLTKDTGTDYDVSWTTPSSGGVTSTFGNSAYVPEASASGYYFWASACSGAAASTTFGIGQTFLVPVAVGADCIINKVAIYNTTGGAATNSWRVGLYEATASRQPGLLIQDFSTAAVNGSIGLREVTFSNLAVSRGMYYIAVALQGTGTSPAIATFNGPSILLTSNSPGGAGGLLNANGGSLSMTNTFTGAFPGTMVGQAYTYSVHNVKVLFALP